MPFLSPKRRVSDAENKLRLLLCLRALGMATSDQLWPFVAGLELMEYLPYCLLLDELKKDGEVAQGRFALEGVLYLTPRGEKTLSLLRDKLTHTDCERIRAAAPAYAAGLNERRQAAAAYRRAEPGRYGAVGTVREGDVPALVLDADTPDEALARAVVRGFRACAPRLLTLLYTLPFEAGGRHAARFEESGGGNACGGGGTPGAAGVRRARVCRRRSPARGGNRLWRAAAAAHARGGAGLGRRRVRHVGIAGPAGDGAGDRGGGRP